MVEASESTNSAESAFRQVAERSAPCKCCGSEAPIFGVVDFHKHCLERHGRVLPPSGIPIYYYRCVRCSFVFATAFDRFGSSDFRRHIYNDDYAFVDPEYAFERPRSCAAMLCGLFGHERPGSILDYGCGTGRLVEFLRANGFPNVQGYDPFVEAFSAKPAEKFECVVSFETIEHSPDPGRTIADMSGFVADEGLVLFSTVLQPPDFGEQGLSWWYVAPRNGHVSIHTRESLAALAAAQGLRFGSLGETLHVFVRRIPEFAKRFLVER